MMTYKILDAMRTGVPLPLFNGGNMHRDWTFVSDVVSGVVAALDKRPADRSTAHLLSNVWAETVDPDHARVHYYLTLRESIAKPNEPAVFRTGGVLYGTDHYVQLAEGWRIQSKGTQPVLAAADTEKS